MTVKKALQKIISDNTNFKDIQNSNDASDNGHTMAHNVATEILAHYDYPGGISTTNTVGFWWHENHGMGGMGRGLDVIYLHAKCNPNTHINSGPWQIEKKYVALWESNKSVTREIFEKAGFHCIQDDGANTGSGDKALGFVYTQVAFSGESPELDL